MTKEDTVKGVPSIPIPKEFEEVLANNDLRDLFRHYLKNHLASECLLFYENVELYEMIDRQEFRKRAAKGLLIKFILDPSQYRINISDQTKQKLLDTSKSSAWMSNVGAKMPSFCAFSWKSTLM